MTTRSCAHCGQPFQPRHQVPNQTYCSSPECQRARKRLWQRDKLSNDPDYRSNQRDAQRAWFDRHPGYWRSYRATNPSPVEGGQTETANGANAGLAKMDVSTLAAGLYQLRPIAAASPRENEGWLVEITPACIDCPCKKDACKEMT